MGVEFDEPSYGPPPAALQQSSSQGGLRALIVKHGFAKDLDEANRFLLIVAIIAFAAAACFILPSLMPEKPAEDPSIHVVPE